MCHHWCKFKGQAKPLVTRCFGVCRLSWFIISHDIYNLHCLTLQQFVTHWTTIQSMCVSTWWTRWPRSWLATGRTVPTHPLQDSWFCQRAWSCCLFMLTVSSRAMASKEVRPIVSASRCMCVCYVCKHAFVCHVSVCVCVCVCMCRCVWVLCVEGWVDGWMGECGVFYMCVCEWICVWTIPVLIHRIWSSHSTVFDMWES